MNTPLTFTPRTRSSRPIRSHLLQLVTVLGLSLCVSRSPAATFSLTSRVTEIPEQGEVTFKVLKSPGHEFVFREPNGWRAQLDANTGVMTWTSPDYSSVLRLKVQFQGSGQPAQLRSEDLRQVVLQELPAARISEEFTCHGACGSGPGFDLERTTPDQPAVSARIAFLSYPGGVAQVLLSCPAAQFRQRQLDLTGLVNSLRVEAK